MNGQRWRKTLTRAAVCLLAFGAAAQAQDCTADGIAINQLTGQPIAGVQIGAESPDSRGASSDADGRWTIPGLPCGHLRLSVWKTGFTYSPAARPDTKFHDVHVELVPEASIGGRVTDGNGDPPPVGIVTLSYLSGALGRPAGSQQATLEARDSYRFVVPFAGNYRVCARSGASVYPIGGGLPMRYPEVCESVKARAGAEARADLTLTAVPTAHIRGRVEGVPAGVDGIVDVRKRGEEDAQPVATQIAAGNRFEFSGIIPGDYTVQMSAVIGEQPVFAIEDVSVGSGGIENLSLNARPSVTLTGRVRFESDSGKKIPRMDLRLQPDSGILEWDDAGDTFTLSHIPPRKYRIAANAQTDAYVKSVELDGRNIAGQEVALDAEGRLEIVLADDFGEVEGTVTDAEGNPVSCWIYLRREETESTPGVNGRLLDNGKFDFRVPPGHYRIFAGDDPGQPDGKGTPVDVPARGSVSVTVVKARVGQ